MQKIGGLIDQKTKDIDRDFAFTRASHICGEQMARKICRFLKRF
jgi:hypothetical protein